MIKAFEGLSRPHCHLWRSQPTSSEPYGKCDHDHTYCFDINVHSNYLNLISAMTTPITWQFPLILT